MVGLAGTTLVGTVGRGMSVALSEIAGLRGARRNAWAAMTELNRCRSEREDVAAWLAERERVARRTGGTAASVLG